VRRDHKDASQGVGVSESVFVIFFHDIQWLLGSTPLNAPLRRVKSSAFLMQSIKIKKAPSEKPTPWNASLWPLLTGSGFVFRSTCISRCCRTVSERPQNRPLRPCECGSSPLAMHLRGVLQDDSFVQIWQFLKVSHWRGGERPCLGGRTLGHNWAPSPCVGDAETCLNKIQKSFE